jgi:hypothetical protein
MDEPVTRKTPLGCNTAWAMKLKDCIDAVAGQLGVKVLSAKPVQAYSPQDPRDMLFEVSTTSGELEVVRGRSGIHTFFWK